MNNLAVLQGLPVCECARNESVRITPSSVRFWRQVVAVLDLATRCSNHGVIGPNASMSWVQTTYLVVDPGGDWWLRQPQAPDQSSNLELITDGTRLAGHGENVSITETTVTARVDRDVHVSKMCIL